VHQVVYAADNRATLRHGKRARCAKIVLYVDNNKGTGHHNLLKNYPFVTISRGAR
jgi:hypothetical protein